MVIISFSFIILFDLIITIIIKTFSYYYKLLKLFKDYENSTGLERCRYFYILFFFIVTK